MQLAPQHLRPTKEHARFRRGVNLADRAERHIPVRTAEVGWCAETGDGVTVRVDVVDHDVGGVVGFDFSGQVLGREGELVWGRGRGGGAEGGGG